MNGILQTFWDALFGVDTSSGGIYTFVELILKDTIKLTGVFVTIYIAYKVMLFFSDINSKLDPFVLIRPIMLLCIMALYSPLVNLLIKQPMGIVSDVFETHISGAAPVVSAATLIETPPAVGSFDEKFQAALTHVDTGAAAGPGLGLYDILAINPFLELIHIVIYLAATMIGYYMMFRQIILIAIYYIVGTIALPFSLVIGNQDVARNWYFGFIGIMMWKPMLIIMKGIIIAINPASLGFQNAIFSVALQIVMILTILQIPKFASLVVSKGAEVGSGIGSNFLGSIGKMFK